MSAHLTWGLLVFVALAQGCVPRCQRVCDKLLACEALSTDRFSHAECEDSCQRQVLIFEGWEDEDQLEDASDAQRRCVVDSTCAEIADGVCYDERLFQFSCPDC